MIRKLNKIPKGIKISEWLKGLEEPIDLCQEDLRCLPSRRYRTDSSVPSGDTAELLLRDLREAKDWCVEGYRPAGGSHVSCSP